MDEPEGSHRTRSRAAPDWTVPESLVLVNEIGAVEAEWGATLPSFQKWQQIVENCYSFDVNRSLNQCKRHWEALLSSYRRVKHDASPDFPLPIELFNAIDRCVRATAKRNGGGGEDAEKDEETAAAAEGDMEEQVVMMANPDSEPDKQARVSKSFFETGSTKRRMKRQKRSIEAQNPWGYFTDTKFKLEESSSINANVETTDTMNTINPMPKEEKIGLEEQRMAKILHENALQIHAIVEGKLIDDMDYKLADLRNAEAVQTDFTRRQGDNLIDRLGKIFVTLNQLCDLIEPSS